MMTGRMQKGTVKRNAIKHIERRKAEQRKEFAMRYDSPKAVTFVDADNLNMDRFRVISKEAISGGLSQAALAVYPVLCAQADFEQEDTFQIFQKNIAFLAGISEDTARKAVKELEAVGLLSREKVTEGTRHFYIYRVNFIRKSMLDRKQHKGGTVYFYICIIDNGIWAALSLGAKGLYLVLRATATQDLDAYSDIEGAQSGQHYEPMEYDEYIRRRKWDVCSLSLAEISRAVGIGRGNVSHALAEVERYGLVERIGEWIKVYLRPRRLLAY